MSTLQVRLLGRFEIICQDRQLSLPPTRKAQALLAYLILHREQPQPRDRLAEMFWGDWPDEKARRSLSTAIWHLTHCLPVQNALLSTSNAVQFNPQVSLDLDIDRFIAQALHQDIEGLEIAVQLYRGEFLPGSYEDWIIQERYQLENHYLDAIGRLMYGYESVRKYQLALDTALHLLRLDSLREDAHRTAMRIYSRFGKRNKALEQYGICCDAIHQDLGAEPMPETRQLHQAILDGKYPPDREVVSEPEKTGIAQSQEMAINPLDIGVIPPFTGRDSEILALDSAWKQALEGRSRAMLIEGEAGVGKTRFVMEFTQHLRWQGIPVMWGRCYEFERLLPYQPVAEALASLSPEMLPERGVDLEHFQEVVQLVPELANTFQENIAPAGIEVPMEQVRLFKGIRQLIHQVSKPNGLLLVIEDLHWGTESTIEILHYLVRNLAAAPILIVCTVRVDALDHRAPFHTFKNQLKGDGLLSSISLKRLTPADIEVMITKMSGQGEVVKPLSQRLYLETEGNPFFVMECVKALFDKRFISIKENLWEGDFDQISTNRFPLPANLSEAIRYRMSQLEELAQKTISIASVIGREFDFDLLNEVGGGNREQTLVSLDSLLRRQIIEEGCGTTAKDYAFTHHKIQEVIYSNLATQYCRQIHGQIGCILEQKMSGDVRENLGELAYHFYHSKEINQEFFEKAIRYSLQAGDQARMMYANKEAIGYYNQALGLLQEARDFVRTARVKMKLGVTYHNAFEYENAHQAYEEGFHLWQVISQYDHAPVEPAPHALRTNWPPITSLDPAFGMDFAGAVGWQLFCGLVAFSPELEVVPEAARKWEVYSGGCEYVFHLRDNLKWSDGRPLTAYDFEFSGKRMLSPETKSPFANLLYDVKGAAPFHRGEISNPDWIGFCALDEGTFQVKLEKPTSYFLQLLANFLAVPRHCIETSGGRWTEPKNIATSGPFTIREWRSNEYLLLEKYPHYHEQQHGNIQQVRLDLQPDPFLSMEKYTNGELDVLDMRFFPIPVFDHAIRRFTDEYFSSPAASLCFIGFNSERPPFIDENVRKAFALAINKEILANIILRGTVYPATGGFIPPGLPGHLPAIGQPFKPELARELLKQAGWPAGKRFIELEALSPFDPSNPMIKYLTGQWEEELGISVCWKCVSPGLHLLLDSKPAHLFLSFWHADYPDPDDFLGASQILRWTGWGDENFTGLLDETKSAGDQNRRMSIFNQADRYLVDKAVVVPITYNRQHFLFKPWVKRYPTSALYSWFWKDVVIDAH